MPRKSKQLVYFEANGRRRESTARVRLYIVGKDKTALVGTEKIKAGEIMVNNKPSDVLFGAAFEKQRLIQPFRLSNAEGRFAVSVRVRGGGRVGQLEAILHGLSRALVKVDEANRKTLKIQGLLTRDPRTRERRKVGTGGKARRQKQSPKR